MQIFLSPELMTQEYQIINVINQNEKAIGYVTFLIDEKKMYVYGLCEEEGVSEDFKDLIKPYIQGMSKAKPELDVYSYISIGGKKLEIGDSKSEK
ncbi:hypothetical protein [Litchfieldia salsa]|uniref:Uncharacterized protein n=1 Tax=Litchfieldia salsa TaxID=930152 RepID=A0A1H0TGE4_9BACI|nr:hypothetical protein [Litchfieldia salsa]SDP52891.1 hypothetical protein SAMN05216565_103497 [Litchfieldia salsa]